MATPATQRALVVQSPGVAKLVHDRPVPKLRDDYILVKTKAVALNPTDWKHIDFLVKEAGPLVGCDYAGVVEAVGSKVTNGFKKGDRVCGVAHGSNVVQPEDGTFAEYIVAKAELQIKIPSNLSFEEAATLGVGITTVGQGLYQSLGLALPTAPVKEPATVLIYGGSSATGALGIQFAKLSGYKVVTTCSARNFDTVTALGADAAFDYKDPDCAKKIREYTKNELAVAWDTISTADSAKICADALRPGAGARYSALGPVEFPRGDVDAALTMAYTAIGEAYTMGGNPVPAKPQDLEFAVKFWDIARGLLEAGKVKVHKPSVKHGLENVLDGLQALKENKVSGEKLVYTV